MNGASSKRSTRHKLRLTARASHVTMHIRARGVNHEKAGELNAYSRGRWNNPKRLFPPDHDDNGFFRQGRQRGGRRLHDLVRLSVLLDVNIPAER